jgi:hypothetical protein
MNEFPPPRQPGSNILIALMVVFAAVSALGIFLAAQTEVSLRFMLYVLLAVLAFLPLPFLAYRFYALMRANYTLDRNQFTLQWGLRAEQIPVSDVEWVRPLAALAGTVHLPVLRLPGSVLGVRHHPDLGPIEFLASNEKKLLLVATARRVYAISPADAAAFMAAFQRAIEVGSLVPAPAQSVYPSFVVSQAWESRLARFSWLSGLLLNVGLLLWAGLTIPSSPRVALGFFADRTPAEPVPGVYLLLLPIVSLFFFAVGWAAGLFFYRRPDQRGLAHTLWIFNAVSSLLFLIAMLFIVITPV